MKVVKSLNEFLYEAAYLKYGSLRTGNYVYNIRKSLKDSSRKSVCIKSLLYFP